MGWRLVHLPQGGAVHSFILILHGLAQKGRLDGEIGSV